MRLPSFRLPKPHASAIYCSATPLFDFALARQPLADGTYRSIADGAAIGFERHDTAYRVRGDASPETVTLIPIASRPDAYVFSNPTITALPSTARSRQSETASASSHPKPSATKPSATPSPKVLR